MKIKILFWIIVSMLFVVISLLSYYTFHLTSSTLFFITEVLIVVLIILLILFYRRIIKPLYIIGNGMDLLKEQDFSSRLNYVGQPEADKIVDIFNRMMSQLKDERLRLREQNQFLDLLIKASPMGVVILDFDNLVQSLNPVALRLLGKEIMGRSLCVTDSPETDLSLASELSKLKPGESRIIRLNDASIYKCTCSTFSDRGFSHIFYLIEILTEEVFKAERKAYEKVIRMIAHEVNNTIGGITSTLDMVQSTIGQTPQTADLINVLRIVIERCYSMNGFIKSFADVVRIPEPQFCKTDLNTLILNNKLFFESLCQNRHIQIMLELSEDTPIVHLDNDLFQQVLVNIIKNAAESIDHDGKIYIHTISNPPLLDIADTGKGISEETASKLFTPFYSTKPNGQGVGLIFIREVLNKHRFSFSLHTDSDGLTHFKIKL